MNHEPATAGIHLSAGAPLSSTSSSDCPDLPYAIQLVGRAAAQLPDRADVRAGLDQLLEGACRRAAAHADAGRREEALVLCQAVLAVRPEHGPAQRLRDAYAADLLRAAEAHRAAGRQAEALQACRQAAELDPGNAGAVALLEELSEAAGAAGELTFSIGITTFDKRFAEYFKPLVSQIKAFRPDAEILVCVNGNHDQPFNEEYRRGVLEFCALHARTFPIVFSQFRSLSKMWNSILINASKDYVLMLNDDVSITDGSALAAVEAMVREHGTSFKVNSSWSHVLLKRSEIDEIGYFDERLLGIGSEDGDMEWRYHQAFGRPIHNARVDHVVNHFSQTSQDNINKRWGKYSSFNEEFVFGVKYRKDPATPAAGLFGQGCTLVSPGERQYPYERFFWENRHRL